MLGHICDLVGAWEAPEPGCRASERGHGGAKPLGGTGLGRAAIVGAA
jgi:hypothetical protein